MRTELLRNVAFILLFVAVVLSAERLMDAAYNRKSSTKITKLLEHQIDDAIMIWGSSNAQVQINPNILSERTGMSSYNMGWYGTYFEQYSCLMNEYLSYTQKCKCMVICCSFDNMGKNTLVTRPDLYLSHLSNKHVYESLHDIEPNEIARARFIPGYKFGLLSKNYYRTIFFGNPDVVDPNRGYEPQDLVWSATDSTKPFEGRHDETVYRKFHETIDAAIAKGITVIVVTPPIYVDGYRKITNAGFIKSKYKDLTTKSVNIHYLDYSIDSICSEKNLFYNNSHLNRRGATLFSERLASDINGIFKSKMTAQRSAGAN